MPICKSRTLALAIGSLLSCHAAANQAPPALEEVLVTATKREQSLQDIPLSVAAVTGDKLDEIGVENLADLTVLVPNIHFTQTGLSTQMRIRGIGSDNSQGFEQSVAVYADGIFRGRAQLFRAPMFDMDRVEVMRGPQSTLFGKNSIAGALDLITAKPTHDLTGSLTASYEAEYGTTEFTTVVSGPLTESLRGRIALRKYDDPGYFKNTYKGTDEVEQDIASGRISLEWDATDDLTINYIGERNTFDTYGRAVEMTLDEPSLIPPAASPFGGLTFSQILNAFGAQGLEAEGFDGQQDYTRQTGSPELSKNRSTSHTLKASWDVKGYTLTSLTGSVKYDYIENCDCDFTPTPILDLRLEEDYSQLSQEFRIASPLGDNVEWLGGIFFQTYDQYFYDILQIPKNSLLVPLLAPQIPTAVLLGDSGASRGFNQSSNTQAVFGQATWNIKDDFRVIVGGRYTHESKRSDKEVNAVKFNGDAYSDAEAAIAYNNALIFQSQVFKTDTEQLKLRDPNAQGHNIIGNRSESAFTPLLIAQWDINDDSSTYFSYTKGFKAGGFDPRSNKPTAFEFEEEKATAYELGYKSSVWDHRGEINLALFLTNYDNLQVSQFDGAVGFNVGNAKKTRVQGLELDGRVAISNHLTASYGLALLDFEYLDFKNGNCYFNQVGVNNDVGIEECDYTGKSGVYTPDYTFNLGFDYRRDVGQSLEFAAVLDTQFVDGYQVHVNLDPKGEIDSHTLMSLRLQIGADNWHAAILGKNLLDEAVLTYSANAPLSGGNFQTNTFYSFVNRPRTVALEAAFKF